jgi:hypothetical protein
MGLLYIIFPLTVCSHSDMTVPADQADANKGEIHTVKNYVVDGGIKPKTSTLLLC